MTPERYNALMDNEDLELTEDEMLEGWHFCMDWDFLLVGPGMEETQSCHCDFSTQPPKEKDNATS